MKKHLTLYIGLTLLLATCYLPRQLKAQNITVSNSLGMIKLLDKNNVGVAAGASFSFPMVKAVDIGFSYQYAMSSKSPSDEQSISIEEINTVYHYSHHEFGIYGSLSLINANRYKFSLRPGFLANKYIDSYLIPEHFIDSDTNLKAYISDHRTGWLYGANFSIENSISITKALTVSLATGISLYNTERYNNFSGSLSLAYKINYHKQ
jgi:hypothetical protein